MSALNEERLGELRQAKLRGLVRGSFDVAEGVTTTFRSGATLVADECAFVLIDHADEGSLGGALVWFARQSASELHVIVDTEAEVAAVLARQAQQFARPPTIWQLVERVVTAVEPADRPGLASLPPDGAEPFIEMLDAAGVDVVIEHGVVKGEVLGLEVARIVEATDDPDVPRAPGSQEPGGCLLEVGIGRFDREVAAMLHANMPTSEALARAVELVRTHRTADGPPHPLRDLVPERWVRHRVIADPALVGAATLAACDTTIDPPNLRARQPAAAIGLDDDGRPVLVVCSSGVDVALVPIAADTRAWHDPEARLVLAVEMRGLPQVVRDVAASLRTPADVVELASRF